MSRFDIARYAVRNPVLVWLLIVVTIGGGLLGYGRIEQLEDPAFTIRQAVVVTLYPGANAEQVEREVTDVLESAIQRMSQLEEIRSISRPGYSEIRVEIRDTFSGDVLPQIWSELRHKVGDAQGGLPAGATPPMVNDDFGDVFGIYYAVTGDGLNDTELHEALKILQRVLVVTEGVGAVEFAGLATERFVVEIPQARLAALQLSPQDLAAALGDAEQEIPGGALRADAVRVRVTPTGAFDSVESLRLLPVGQGAARVLLGDIAEIRREFTETPSEIIRYDGQPAATLAVAGLPTANIVDVGAAVDVTLAELLPTLPAGFELHPIYEQPDVVDDAVGSFMINLLISLVVVIGLICIFMGLRAGLIIGVVVALSVAGTFLAMFVFDLQLERVSLAALLIAMGMLVDNALVIQDAMLVGLRQGKSRLQAAADALRATQWALLGATVIGILAFAGIGLSQDATGEFLGSLFIVILVSLLLSWLYAVLVIPLFGVRWLKEPEQGEADADPVSTPADGSGEHAPTRDRDGEGADGDRTNEDGATGRKHPAEDPVFQGRAFAMFRRWLRGALRRPGLVIGATAALTVLCMFGFTRVPQAFFPPSTLPIGLVNIHIRQGADVRATADAADEVATWVRDTFPEIEHVVAFAGSGGHRFMLTYQPERPDPSYAQLMLMVEDEDRLPDLLSAYNSQVGERFPELQTYGYQMVFGRNPEARVEARFIGEDTAVLRALSTQAQTVMREAGLFNVRDDWRERDLVIRPELDLERMAEAGVTREDVSQALRMATEGLDLATLREGDEQRPVSVRLPAADRPGPEAIGDLLVWSSGGQRFVPLSQLARDIGPVQEEAVAHRIDRERVLNVRGEPPVGVEPAVARDAIVEAVEAIELPPGYRMEWGGVHEASADSSGALMSTLGLPYLGMVLITILLFGGVRQAVVVWLVVPMSICGVTIGLLLSGIPFGFMALLGLLSLTGLLLKNAIVLVEEIDARIDDGAPRMTAIVEGTTSRVSPVVLLCGTTVAGMIPLLFDPLFASMAVTIMGGLIFATVLTLFVVPALYLKFFKVREHETVEAGR